MCLVTLGISVFITVTLTNMFPQLKFQLRSCNEQLVSLTNATQLYLHFRSRRIQGTCYSSRKLGRINSANALRRIKNNMIQTLAYTRPGVPPKFVIKTLTRNSVVVFISVLIRTNCEGSQHCHPYADTYDGTHELKLRGEEIVQKCEIGV